MYKTNRGLRATLLAFTLPAAIGSVSGEEIFTDEAKATGLEFVYFNGMSGEFYFVENLGGGIALLDYDKDGDLDVYLTQGHMLGEGKTLSDALFPPPQGQALSDRLFRNDLVVDKDGTRRLHFTDVTEASGIHAPGYGMGATAGDYDNDGWVDLYVTNHGHNQLWHNNGDGSFTEVGAKTGVDQAGWGLSGTFFDYDRDGHLDLYVVNYVHFDLDKNKKCYALSGAQDYCGPQYFEALVDRLYHNRGDGSFEDVTERAGIAKARAPGLGVIAADFNNDGWADLYVANDAKPNQLWINQQDGTFKDEAFLAGVAVNMEGAPEASMGVDAADFDNDGDEDLFMTHLQGETNTIYVNDGQGWFEDRTLATGLGTPSKEFTAFGTAWLDYDNDGWMDLYVANGDVRIMPMLARGGDKYPLRQTNQLFRNLDNGRFKEVTAEAGKVFAHAAVSRGTAVGDLDNDGDTDLLVANNNGPLRLLINQAGTRNHWLGLRLVERHGRDALGAKVMIERAEDPTLWRRVRSDGSYASANDPRLLVGLGQQDAVKTLRIHWPDGRRETWSGVAPDAYVTLRQGQGKEIRP
jgi:hypothetical protein